MQPSFAGVVASVDAHASKYVATLRMQTDRQERIEDLRSMTQVSGSTDVILIVVLSCVQYLLTRYMWYRREKENVASAHQAPKRLIFYRGKRYIQC